MRKSWLPFLLSILLVPAVGGTAAAQTADEIAEKVLAALGGRDALSKLTSRRSIGTITVSSPQGDINGTIEINSKAPNKSSTHIELDLSAMGMPDKMMIDQKFDGTTGSNINSMQGEQEWTPNQLQNLRNSSFPTPLLNYKARGTTLEALPKETVAGKSYLVLKATPKEGSFSKIYIDPDTFLPARSITTVTMAQVGEVEQTVELFDYRAVDGVKLPFRQVNTNSLQSATFKFTKVEHNVEMPDALFRKAALPMSR